MKVAIGIFILYYTVVSSAFDLYSSMDDARSAIMSFYDPTHVAPRVSRVQVQEKATVPTRPPNVGVIAAMSLGEVEKTPVALRPLSVERDRLDSRKHTKVTMDRVTPRYRPLPLPSSVRTVRYRRMWRRPLSKPLPRPTPKPTRTAIKTSSPVIRSKRVSLNKFAEAIEDIEKALADAQIVNRVRHDANRLRKLRDLIKTAVQKRSYRFARKAIGEAMFTIRKINEQRYEIKEN